jgi:hypothetical protein
MSLLTEENLIQTLDSYSGKSWLSSSNTPDISAWGDFCYNRETRKSTLTADKTLIRASKENRIPSLKRETKNEKKNSLSVGQRYSGNSTIRCTFRINPNRPGTSFQKINERPASLMNSLLGDTSKIKTIQENLGLIPRKIKLQDYCGKNFLIPSKSPPIISGYPVIFYHK